MATLVEHLGEVSGYGITSQNGKLFCKGCMPAWGEGVVYEPCAHVWDAMKIGLDAGEENGLSGIVTFPLFRDRVQGTFVIFSVDVRHQEAKHGMSPFYTALMAPGDAPADRIGWLAHSEGRWAARRVTLEYLRSLYREILICCSSNTHSHYLMSPTERRNQDLDSTSETVIAALASMAQYGVCWRCLNSDGADLIPDL